MTSPMQREDAEGSEEIPSAQPLTLLAPALWQRLSEASTSEDLAVVWLALQCSMIPGATRGIVRIGAAGGFKLLSSWPEAGDEPVDLKKTADLAAAERRAVARGANVDSDVEPSVGF